MSTKNKKQLQASTPAEQLVAGIGYTAMSLAALLSLFELHDNRATKIAPKAETGFNAMAENINNRVEELIRREKEETDHAIVSYGQAMRSHPVSGKA